jgi:hypothetical protein
MAMGLIVLAVLFFVNGRGGGKAVEAQYSLALRLVLSVWLVLQGCIVSFNPKRLPLAYFLIACGLLTLGINIYLILHR